MTLIRYLIDLRSLSFIFSLDHNLVLLLLYSNKVIVKLLSLVYGYSVHEFEDRGIGSA